MITIKDVNGNFVLIEEKELSQALANEGFRVFGLNLNEINLLRKLYMSLGGRLPITKESIEGMQHET